MISCASCRSVLALNAVLHCDLVLNNSKHNLQLKRMKKRLAKALADLNVVVNSAASEALVLRGVKARMESRVRTLKELVEDLEAWTGIFASSHAASGMPLNGASCASIDNTIIAKKNEIKGLLSSMEKIERHTQFVRDTFTSMLKGFQIDIEEENKHRGIQLDLPEDAILTMRRFYQNRQDLTVAELSLNLDTSESSCNGTSDLPPEPSFVDELKIYQKKFNLENNRKLVLESGDKIWIFETLDASVRRLYTALRSDDVTCSLVCPSVRLSDSLWAVASEVRQREELTLFLEALESSRKELKFSLDITPYKEEEDEQTDKIKKRLSENILTLHKSNKVLGITKENLKLWSDCLVKKHISCNRKVDGKTFREYETMYLRDLNPTI